MTYAAPVNAMHYLMRHAVDIDQILATETHSDVSHELIADILKGAASFSEDVLAPINRDGDLNPATVSDGDVTASPGFKEAYQAFVEAGWQSLSTPETAGGMGLPQAVSVAANEMIYASNMAFGLCPMLTGSAVKALMAHASDDLKALYLEKMVTGEWTGAMNLTEPQAGSDLGPVRTKAALNPDGTYAITGQKIYITWGDHDCADNIIHLVLARLPDAPSGSKGISLFLCPKYFVNADGSLGERNHFKPIGLEHKLGIHGSPTCVMEFDGATGWLIGEENRGLACMFTMMNEARLFVGVQGVAIGDRAYQGALTFAHDRVQGRVIDGQAGDPILGHPDVRRMLIDMKARLMGARAICMATAAAGDLAGCAADEEARTAAHTREALLTPIAKSYGSDTGVSATSVSLQVFGGMGFVEETGAAQHYRDSRISSIYEGTNGIQAIDLIGRKLRRDGGAGMAAMIDDLIFVRDLVQKTANETGADLSNCDKAMSMGIDTLQKATQTLLDADEKSALTFASDYLAICGDIMGGAFLIKAACNGLLMQDPLAKNMLTLAQYQATSIMPQATARLDFLGQDSAAIFDFPVEQLADL